MPIGSDEDAHCARRCRTASSLAAPYSLPPVAGFIGGSSALEQGKTLRYLLHPISLLRWPHSPIEKPNAGLRLSLRPLRSLYRNEADGRGRSPAKMSDLPPQSATRVFD